jgi:hypothetical protein
VPGLSGATSCPISVVLKTGKSGALTGAKTGCTGGEVVEACSYEGLSGPILSGLHSGELNSCGRGFGSFSIP